MASVQAGELLPRWNAFNFRYLQFANEWPESLISARSIALSHRTRWPRRRAPSNRLPRSPWTGVRTERRKRRGSECCATPFATSTLTTLFCPNFVSSAGSRVPTIVIERKDPDYRSTCFQRSPPTSCDRNPISSSPSLLRCARYDADAEGADWREVARSVLHLDPVHESDRARRAFDSHLSRAKWMTEHGYRHLLRDVASA